MSIELCSFFFFLSRFLFPSRACFGDSGHLEHQPPAWSASSYPEFCCGGTNSALVHFLALIPVLSDSPTTPISTRTLFCTTASTAPSVQSLCKTPNPTLTTFNPGWVHRLELMPRLHWLFGQVDKHGDENHSTFRNKLNLQTLSPQLSEYWTVA